MNFHIPLRTSALFTLILTTSASAPHPRVLRGIGCVTELSGAWSFEAGNRRTLLEVGSVIPGPGTLHPPANSPGHEFVTILYRSGRHQRHECATPQECSWNFPVESPASPPHGVGPFLDWLFDRFRRDRGHLKSMIGALPPTTSPVVLVQLERDTMELREILDALPGEAVQVALVSSRTIVDAPEFARAGHMEVSGGTERAGVEPGGGVVMRRAGRAGVEVAAGTATLLAVGSFSADADRSTRLAVSGTTPGVYGLVVTTNTGRREIVWLWARAPRENDPAAEEFQAAVRLVGSWDANARGDFATIFLRSYLVYLASR